MAVTKIASMSFKDHFSAQSALYARHRPHYPPALFSYLASLVATRGCAWDCGTGSGQAALGLAPHFERVIASDASQSQIAQAPPHDKISYQVAKAEEAAIPAHTVDLVTVAQALHWFDFDAFYAKVRDALKPEGRIAAWCYGLHRISPDIDAVIDVFYHRIVGPFWPPDRKWVEEAYQTIPFPFSEIPAPSFQAEARWTYDDLVAYLRTWSATQRYIDAHDGGDPVALIADRLQVAWGADLTRPKSLIWPLHLRVGFI